MCAWLPKQGAVESMEARMNAFQQEQLEILKDPVKLNDNCNLLREHNLKHD